MCSSCIGSPSCTLGKSSSLELCLKPLWLYLHLPNNYWHAIPYIHILVVNLYHLFCSEMLVQVNHPSCTVESSVFQCLNHRNLSVLGVDCSLFRCTYCKYHFTADFLFIYGRFIGRRFQYQDGQSFLWSAHVCFL